MRVMSYRAETMLNIWNSHKKCREGVNSLISERAAVAELCEIKFKASKLLKFIAPIFYDHIYYYGKFKYGKPYLTGKKVEVSLGKVFSFSGDLQECCVDGKEKQNS